jgi:hypothetical protein
VSQRNLPDSQSLRQTGAVPWKFQAFLDLVYVGKVNQFSGIAKKMKLETGTELI